MTLGGWRRPVLSPASLAAAAALVWCLPGVTVAQLAFSGYVMEIPAWQRLRDPIAQLARTDPDQVTNVARIRLRPALDLWPSAQLAAEYEISALYSSGAVSLEGSGGRARGQLVDLTWVPVNREHLTVLHTIDRLSLKQWFSFGDLTLGRQRIAWGTGRVWNPTDLFNPINPATFTKIEKDGVDAAVLKSYLGSFTDLTLVYNPEENWRTNAGFRFRTNVAEYDLALVGGVFRRSAIVGADFAGNLFDAGLRGEGIWAKPADSQGFVRFVLGADYQFSADIYALVEYQHNGEGAKAEEEYDVLSLLQGRILNLARNYIAVQGTYLLHPLVTSMLSYIQNIDDGSGFAGARVSWSATEEMSVSAGGQIFLGGEGAEYWYYPAAVYLQADMFF